MVPDSLVYVLVLAWNHKEDTTECLTSFLASDFPNVRYAVIDNGSADGTAELVREKFPAVEIIASPTNLGIAGGYNLGMDHALQRGADFVLVANNDISVDPGMIGCLVEAMAGQGGQNVPGVAMPKIYHYYGDRTRLWCTGARWRCFPPGVKMTGVNAKDGPAFAAQHDIAYAPSCCLLISRAALQAAGGFDIGYFFYNDDWDFCARVRQAGYRILFVPGARMWHKVSASTQKSDKPAIWWQYMGRSTVRFYLRHAGAGTLAGFAAWFVIRESLKLKFARIRPFLQGLRLELRVERGRSSLAGEGGQT